MSADKQTRHKNPRKPRSDFQRLSRRFMSGFLRSLFLINKPARAGQAGFVLPTTVLLLLVMTLTVGALSFRAVSRTQSTFLAREQKMIDNVAAPAADRAKSKLEYLFGKDTRMPGTNTPSSDVLVTLMLNVDSTGAGGLGITRLGTDPYTLPDEARIDINNDGTLDNAWSFPYDLNGDGNINGSEIIAYSLLMDDSVDPAAVDGNAATIPTATRNDDIKLEDTGDANTIRKANNLITRNGPINTTNTISNCGGSRAPAEGWLTVNNAALEKNFQITAFVSNGKNPGRANSALELQQVRLAQTGNTWGAWFKYDLELHPGPDFNWNGAIHTDGNLLVTNNFKAHMISSHNSCLYTANASDITMAQVDNNNDGIINTNPANSQDFQGQLVAGALAYGDLTARGTPGFHILNGLNAAPNVGTNLTTANDSVTGNTYGHLLNIALDPIALFTKNVSRHRATGNWTRDATWATTNPFSTGGRILNRAQAQPFLDDFYRADNRYGPRPNYQNTNWVTDTDDGTVNTTRSEVEYDKKIGDEIIATDPRADSLTNGSDGLDGYWERKAITNGMRVVVGQRLELGDHLGWNFNAATNAVAANTDPLYPTNTVGMANKQKQRVTLRDNLASVQGMVVYQYETADNMPLSCIANTAHPGTLQTLRSSRTFEHYVETGNTDKVKTDFLEGKGTNGWEFSFPTAFDTETEFGTELANDRPLGIALRNLAYFAGDPKGGSPSFTPVQDTTVHPFAQQAMWGDFSVLRRIFNDELDNTAWRSSTNPPALTTMATRYTALSPADKSSLHSAACTQGLLAYNLSTIKAEYNAIPVSGSDGLDAIGLALSKLMDGINTPTTSTPPNKEIGTTDPVTSLCSGALGTAGCPPVLTDLNYSNYYAQFTTQQWINALENSGLFSGADLTNVKRRVRLIAQYRQIERDRALGFIPATTIPVTATTTPVTPGIPGAGAGYVATTATYSYPALPITDTPFVAGTYKVGCDPTGFLASTNKAKLGLASAFCSIGQSPKYPSLHYLFPKLSHGQIGIVPYLQPTGEEYINQTYLTHATTGVNRAVSYGVVGDDGLVPAVENSDDTGIAAISFLPRASNPIAATNAWKLPTTVSTAIAAAVPINPESMDIKIITTATPISNTNVALSLLDKVMYNGREEMAVRVLDVDLGKLSRNKRTSTGDYWISDDRDTGNGIFYAVREDAAREDTIIRPASTANWTSCDTFTEYLTTNCLMRASATATATPADPPLSKRADGSVVGISTKPIDFAPDPDRRPNGFRLNADLSSNGVNNDGDISDRNNRTWGLTFVTDNAAYIKGTLNPHTSNGTNTLEEFTQTLFDGSVGFGLPFYNNRTTSNLSAFATKTGDRWRVAEVLADAVYLLSNNFVDGAVEEGFIRNLTEVSGDFKNIAGNNSLTSFHNQQRPLQEDDTTWGNDTQWLRIDGTLTSIDIPVWVGRNGESRTIIAGTPKPFIDATVDANFVLPNERDQSALIEAAVPERMNATIISGLVPSRDDQGYGGLHNFPRFLEDWSGDLFIQGAFLQLNFNTAGTGPFDLDAWDPGETPANGELINYYSPPNRRWGYDVALQLSPTGPIAARFVAVGRPRSEHYRELPIEDPYVTNLRCSKVRQVPTNPSSTLVRRFPAETGCPP
jgi:hypothetical protein